MLWTCLEQRNMNSSTNSTDSSFRAVKADILKLLQNKVFLGRYTERRYVESLQAYRDIIVIESSEDIVKNLMQIKKTLENCANNKWIGITNDPQNPDSHDCLLWVQLNDIPIGKHWFQMCAVRFENVEIILEIQHVQPFRSPDKSFSNNDPNFPVFDIKEIFTYQNMCEAVKFSVIVIMALFTFLVETLKYLAKYFIELSHILISLVHVSTPICLGIFEFFAKCVGGFYWLIYVMLRGSSNTPAVPRALLNNQGSYNQKRRSLQYNHRFSNPRQSYSPNSNINEY